MKTLRMGIHRPLVFVWAMVAVLLLVVGSSPAAAKPGEFQELTECREDISLLNLLRGLYLSKEQVGRLCTIALKAQAMRDDLEGQIRKDRDSIQATFQGLRDSLFEAPGREKATQEKASALDHRFKEARGGIDDEIWRLEREAEEVLTSAQQSIVETFRPCLIPPKDLRNPMRVGQASGEPGILGKVADLIHAAPEDVWSEKGSRLLARISDRMQEETGAMTGAMKEDLLGRLRKISGQIRGLTDVDYHLKREELAKEMLLIDPHKALKHGHKKIGPIGNFLLSEAAVRVYPRWLKTMDQAAPPQEASNEEDDKADPSLTEIAAKAMDQLQKLFRRRQAAQTLGPFPDFVAPVKQALELNDADRLFQAMLGCCDRLQQIKTGPDLTRAYVQLSRLSAKTRGLPLLNPKQDPFGFAEDLQSVLADPEAPDACSKARALAGTISRFKKK